MFNVGDRVRVIVHEPTEEWRPQEIPIGTEGIVSNPEGGHAENTQTMQDEHCCWVDFDLPHAEHRWCRRNGEGIQACMFDSMLVLADDDPIDIDMGGLVELFDLVAEDFLKRLEENE